MSKVTNTRQLTLPLASSELPTFDNFVVGPNVETVSALKNLSNEQSEKLCFVYGVKGCGISHLLQSCVSLAEQKNINTLYFSLCEEGVSAEMLSGLDDYDLLYLDHLEDVIPDPGWEDALFHLFNSLRDQGKGLVLGSCDVPDNLCIQLPDLLSRLNGMMRYHLKELTDQDKEAALIKRAKSAGLAITPEVVRFMISRGSRDLRQLIAKLEKLDQASLQSKRAVTIPFVKEVLGY